VIGLYELLDPTTIEQPGPLSQWRFTYNKTDSKPKILIICTINGKKINKVKITYTSKLLRINAVV
jgi:hypothetical protein